MNKNTFLIGFMLFALFFGAGNLIYPPTLGIESGTSYWAAILGFIITGVGLPILAVMAIALVKNDARELGNRVHPLFGVIFTSVIYLAIGPFFGIPRAANVAFEMGLQPIAGNNGALLLVFTICFFVLVFWFSLNPSKIVDRIGQWLTPALFIAVVGLSVGGFFLLNSSAQSPVEKYQSAPFFTGFVEGYLTMDAIAALAFGIIVVTSFNDRGVKTHREMIISTLKAGAIAGISLIFVYGSIGWIGTKMASVGEYENGGAILSSASQLMFGEPGELLLGIIVALACFTTSVGLTVACGQFFSKSLHLSYKIIITIITVISFLVANLGLNQIISISVPVLEFIYPLAIVLILLAFLDKAFGGSRYVYRGAVLLTALFSLYEVLVNAGISFGDAFHSLIELLPFYSVGLGWVFPAIVGGVIGRIIHKTEV